MLNVTDQNEHNWTIAEDTNVIILQYFIAEVYRYKDKLQACLKKLFSCAEQDLFIIAIDMDPVYISRCVEEHLQSSILLGCLR